ncbi:alpha-L-fucosidase C-terminal domain-containing protein, partial [Gemmatimonadota bacterium]
YLELPIPEPPEGTLITLLGRDGDLPWRYRTGSLRVDLSDVPASEIPGQWAWTIRLEGYAAAVPAEPGVDE